MPENKSVMKGLEQNRARFAYECAGEGYRLKKTVKGEEKDLSGNYRSHLKKLAPLILTNGLGQTLAYVKAKGKGDEAWRLVYQQIAGWLNEDDKSLLKIATGADLVQEVVKLGSAPYRAVTVEVLAFTKWLSRFADGLIEKGDEDGD